MYIRRTKTRHTANGESYYSHRLVRSERTPAVLLRLQGCIRLHCGVNDMSSQLTGRNSQISRAQSPRMDRVEYINFSAVNSLFIPPSFSIYISIILPILLLIVAGCLLLIAYTRQARQRRFTRNESYFPV
jgi:Flp pilus assembly protein TadB